MIIDREKKIEFLTKLADLLKEYEVQINTEIDYDHPVMTLDMETSTTLFDEFYEHPYASPETLLAAAVGLANQTEENA